MKKTIGDTEITIFDVIQKSSFTNEDADFVSHLLGSILTKYFSTQDRDINMRRWAVDDMYPDKIEVFKKNICLTGKINWLGGGGSCDNYQVDIARDTEPLLYSFKLKNKRDKQVLYLGKTYEGWVLKFQ